MFSNITVGQLREKVKEIDIEDYPMYILDFKKDQRRGVRELGVRLQNNYEDYLREISRIEDLKKLEENLSHKGYEYIAGVDEVGRGPLAGPVVSSAVILPIDSQILYVNDSKKLTSKKREELSRQIREEAVSVSVGIIDESEIDSLNIYEATRKSMKDAIENLTQEPNIILVDAMKIDTYIPQRSIIKGDFRCYSIAAASIVAKVTRDKMMEEYHELYPQYNFKQNKGYGSREHIEAIKKYGITPIHRRSFLNNILKTATQ